MKQKSVFSVRWVCPIKKQLKCAQVPSSSTWTPAVCPPWLRRWSTSCWTRMRSVRAIGMACWELSSWDAGIPPSLSTTRQCHRSVSSLRIMLILSVLPVSLRVLWLLPLETLRCRPFPSPRRYDFVFVSFIHIIIMSLHLLTCWCFSAERRLWKHGGLSCPLRYVHVICVHIGVSTSGADMAYIKRVIFHRCPGHPGETSGGFCEVEWLRGDGVSPGESHPCSLRLRAGRPQRQRDGLQREWTCHGRFDGRLGEREDLPAISPELLSLVRVY